MMWKRLWREIASARLVPGSPPVELITEAELAALPSAARRMMEFRDLRAGVPKTWSLQVGWRGHFRLGPDRPWLKVEAVQFNTRQPIARVFHMRARMKSLPALARHTYLSGRGRMDVKVCNLVPVADGKGPEFDRGELITWVNDCVLFAPSMLLGTATAWSHVDPRTFDMTFTDQGRSVSARVFVDEAGAPMDFQTTDRFVQDPYDPKHPLVRGRWTTPIDGWRHSHGRPLLVRGRGMWHLPAGEFVYAELEPDPTTVGFDVFPTDMVAAVPM
jgi:hypothetical protein